MESTNSASQPTAAQSNRDALLQALHILVEGVQTLVKNLVAQANPNLQPLQKEMVSISSFFETLDQMKETMPEQRLQEALRNTARSIHTKFISITEQDRKTITGIELDSQNKTLVFVSKAYQLLGPWINISDNAMKAWVQLDKNEIQFFDHETLKTCLIRYGVIRGISDTAIQQIFDKKMTDQQVLVAEGSPAQYGEDGIVKYSFDISSLNHAPKEMANGKVSLEDINLYVYFAEGKEIAKLIPPVPGIPGFTVTDRVLDPPTPLSAILPKIEHTQISEDGSQLTASMDGCIIQKAGRMIFEANLQIKGNVSYETGNINSTILVAIGRDVLPGFSVRTDKDVSVGGVVEGGNIDAKGDIMVKGGILGKEKSVIKSEGNIHAKYIDRAKIFCKGDIVVEKEITHSELVAGGNIILTNSQGEIVGGKISADGEIITNRIGSEIGVVTIIRLGMQNDKIMERINELTLKLEEQDEMQEKQQQTIQTLESQIKTAKVKQPESEDNLVKTQLMLAETEKRIKLWKDESKELQTQLEESAKRAKSLRVRAMIFPGTSITIQGAEKTIQEPAGPCTIIKENDQLMFYPFQELGITQGKPHEPTPKH